MSRDETISVIRGGFYIEKTIKVGGAAKAAALVRIAPNGLMDDAVGPQNERDDEDRQNSSYCSDRTTNCGKIRRYNIISGSDPDPEPQKHDESAYNQDYP